MSDSLMILKLIEVETNIKEISSRAVAQLGERSEITLPKATGSIPVCSIFDKSILMI